jgi:glycosyltransferase involved in cell wall biosynthesis
MPRKTLDYFNDSNTLVIISPYSESGKNFRGYSIARYTRLFVNFFPKTQKVVVFCEAQKSSRPYRVSENILIAPSYKVDSLRFFADLFSAILKFSQIKNVLVQFEFSIFGGKRMIPQFLALLLLLKLSGKSLKITFHQVVCDLGSLSGHLAIGKRGLKTSLLNSFLHTFYKISGFLSDKVFVHDTDSVGQLGKFVDRGKIEVIPHGVKVTGDFGRNFVASAKKHFRVDTKTKLIGIFGYCSWYKGTDWLIENFTKFASNNPDLKVKLLVAGGESPTLRGTLAYKKYHKRLKKVIKRANGNIIYTGFIPEKDVEEVFAACDLMVFPYRTKMSASGAFSLCVGYRKPFIASREFSKNLNFSGEVNNVFSLNYKSFEACLRKNLNSKVKFNGLGSGETWEGAAQKYLEGSLQEGYIKTKLGYAPILQ